MDVSIYCETMEVDQKIFTWIRKKSSNMLKKIFLWTWKDIEKLKSWVKSRHKQIFITFFLAVVTILLIRIGYNYDWTGFTASGDPKSQSYKPAKTLWDWLQLIIIPVVLGSVAFLFNYPIFAQIRGKMLR